MADAQQQNGRGELDWIWGFAALAIIIGAVYYFAPGYFYAPWIALKSLQLDIISYFPVTDSEREALVQSQNWLNTIRSEDVQLKDIVIISSLVGDTMKIPAIGLLCILGFVIAYRPSFRQRHSMESLIRQESRIWPALRLMLKHRPDKEPDHQKGPWAMRQKPVDWAGENLALNNRELNEAKVIASFSQQLGNSFTGIESFSKIEQQLFSIFASRIAGEPALCQKLMDNLNLFYADELKAKVIDKQVNECINRFAHHANVQAILDKHAFTTTALIGLFEAVKAIGILPSSFFLWLKPHHRTLWYTMNDVGRHVASVEAAGPRAHFQAEVAAGCAVSEPAMKTAVTALREGLIDVDAIADVPDTV